MMGRILEESSEVYNGTSRKIKAVVRCMPVHNQRIDKIAERTQGNLKGEVLDSRLAISSMTTHMYTRLSNHPCMTP